MSNTAYRIDLSDNVFFDFDQRMYHFILYVDCIYMNKTRLELIVERSNYTSSRN